MKNKILFPMLINLQLFAEGGGDGGTGAEGATGVSATAAVSQTTGESIPVAEVEKPTEDRNAKYEAFIKEHKDLDDARIQNIVQKRLKSSKETVDKYNELAPTLEALGKKYGVDPSDIKALNKAIEDDDSYYEQEALEKGMTVEQLKEIRKMEKENAYLKKQMEEHNREESAKKIYSKWIEQADSTKQIYPSFNLRAEMQNQKFVDLLRSNIDVRTAYEVIHKDDIIAGAMQFTAKKVEENLANNIIANGARPAENGNSSQGASVTKSDVSALTKEERAEINRRALRGEKITFTR